MAHKFLCFDTESAQGRYKGAYIEELIEISIMDNHSQEVFYHRFKPERLTRWDTKIHHITPSMLADQPQFDEYRDEVQQIFDNCTYIIGFSLIDDFKAMSKAGVKGLEDKTRIELRHLYWYCIARHEGTAFYSGPGLTACAANLGVTVDKEAIHTAHGDTSVTLGLFFALIEMFARQENYPGGCPDPDSPEFPDFINILFKRISEAKLEYDSSVARGYIHVVRHPDGGYRFVPSVTERRAEDDAALTIPVNARKRAAFELEREYGYRRIQNTKNFRLTSDDIEAISHYTNTFDNKEQMYVKLLGLQRAATVVPRTSKRRNKR